MWRKASDSANFGDPEGMTRRPAALGWAAWVEDLEALCFLVERQVRVPEDDGIGLREAEPHALEPAAWPGRRRG